MSKPKFCTLDSDVTTADDPERFVWYAVGCTYWTDNVNAIRKDKRTYIVNGRRIVGGPPTCPKCGSVGYQTTARKFLNPDAIAAFEAEGRADYAAIVIWLKEKCFKNYYEGEVAYRKECR